MNGSARTVVDSVGYLYRSHQEPLSLAGPMDISYITVYSQCLMHAYHGISMGIGRIMYGKEFLALLKAQERRRRKKRLGSSISIK